MSRQIRVALVGAKGMLASAIARTAPAEWELLPLDLPEFDLTRRELVREVLGALRPALVLNCAAFTDVDGCEAQEALAEAVNGAGVGYLAEAAAELEALLVHVSTDYVFDGTKRAPYAEDDLPHPLSAYGRGKLQGERAVLERAPRYLIVRTSWLYGPGGKNFVETIARLATEREELRIVDDQVGSPTYTVDLAAGLSRLLAAGAENGIYHFSNEGACSWYGFARAVVEHLRARGEPLRVRRLLPIPTGEYPLPATRPSYSVLSKEKYRRITGAEVPEWRDALSRYFQERGAAGGGS